MRIRHTPRTGLGRAFEPLDRQTHACLGLANLETENMHVPQLAGFKTLSVEPHDDHTFGSLIERHSGRQWSVLLVL